MKEYIILYYCNGLPCIQGPYDNDKVANNTFNRFAKAVGVDTIKLCELNTIKEHTNCVPQTED